MIRVAATATRIITNTATPRDTSTATSTKVWTRTQTLTPTISNTATSIYTATATAPHSVTSSECIVLDSIVSIVQVPINQGFLVIVLALMVSVTAWYRGRQSIYVAHGRFRSGYYARAVLRQRRLSVKPVTVLVSSTLGLTPAIAHALRSRLAIVRSAHQHY
jgi:phosphatidylserine/phosphatidylglycerophosphate/cardiolipin synthase-like enzyme